MNKTMIERMKKNEKPVIPLTKEESEYLKEVDKCSVTTGLAMDEDGNFYLVDYSTWGENCVCGVDLDRDHNNHLFIFPDGSMLYTYAYEYNSTLPNNIPQIENLKNPIIETGVLEVDEKFWNYFLNHPGDNYELRRPKKGDMFICFSRDGGKGKTVEFDEWVFFDSYPYRWCLKLKEGWVEYPIFIGKSPDNLPVDLGRYLCLVEHFEEEVNWINDLLTIPGFGGIQFEDDASEDWSESLVKIGPNGYPKKPVKARFFVG